MILFVNWRIKVYYIAKYQSIKMYKYSFWVWTEQITSFHCSWKLLVNSNLFCDKLWNKARNKSRDIELCVRRIAYLFLNRWSLSCSFPSMIAKISTILNHFIIWIRLMWCKMKSIVDSALKISFSNASSKSLITHQLFSTFSLAQHFS